MNHNFDKETFKNLKIDYVILHSKHSPANFLIKFENKLNTR